MKPLFATQHEARLIASLPEGGTGMICREVKDAPPTTILGVYPQLGEKGLLAVWRKSGTGVVGRDGHRWDDEALYRPKTDSSWFTPVPFGPIGAVLAVKEAYYKLDEGLFHYKADDPLNEPWQSGATMPIQAVRSYICITGLRVARVGGGAIRQFRKDGDVTEEEIRLLGYMLGADDFEQKLGYQKLGPFHWLAEMHPSNPYVWLYTFEKISREVAHA